MVYRDSGGIAARRYVAIKTIETIKTVRETRTRIQPNPPRDKVQKEAIKGVLQGLRQ